MARNPTRIGRYDLITALATGGMGRIYLGRATGIGGFDRKVVIKTLEVPTTAESDPAIAMFLDEARLLGLLHHQHIASVFEVGRDDDARHYMVIDYVEGVSGHDVWERALSFGAALPLDFTLTVVSAAANGLHYAHTRNDPSGAPLGIVHRDVSPSNLMIGHDGAVKLIDFGIAMAAHRKTKTQTGFVKGKVGYLSPEQVGGRDVDARTDVFALGILLYELSTLHRAFRESSDLATMQRIKAGKVVRPSQLVADYPVELEAIVMKALQVDPRDRFASADLMRRAIEALGHRLHLVLGDAAVIDVMAQLFEPSAIGAGEPPQRGSDPAFEWVASDHDLTVRRDPKELVDMLRDHQAGRESSEATGQLVRGKQAGAGPQGPAGMKPRKLRAATEAADALIVQAAETFSSELPLASPPPTPTHTPLPPARPGSTTSPPPLSSRPGSTTAPPPNPVAVKFNVPAAPAAGVPVAPPPTAAPAGSPSASLQPRSRRVGWFAVAVLVTAAAAGAAYAILRGDTGETAPAPPPQPAAARAPQVAPPPKPSPPPLPAAPTQVRVQIVTRPPGAIVYLDGQKVGKTPLDETMPADPTKHVFTVKHHGYAQARLDLELGTNVYEELTLTPQR